MAAKDAEGGRFGAVDLHSYTWWLYYFVWAAIVAFVKGDIGDEGTGYVRTAFGVQSTGAIWTYVAIGWFASNLPNQQIASLYTNHTGRIAYGDDRIGYAKSGGRDIAYWAGLIPLVALAAAFALLVPPGLFSWMRACLIAIGTGLVGVILGRFFATKLFTALYGPARYTWKQVAGRP